MAHGHDLRRQVVAVLVRRPAIPRAAVGQRRHAGARAGGQPRRLHRRHGRRDRRRGRARPHGLQRRHPRAGRADCWRWRGSNAKPVNPKRLGAVGPDLFPDRAYAIASGDSVVRHRAARRDPVRRRGVGQARATTCGCSSASTARRSPATSTRPATSATSTCSAAGFTTPSPKRRRTRTSPSGSTSRRPTCRSPRDGKEPDLEPFLDAICDAVAQGGAQGAPPGRQGRRVAEGRRARQSRRRHRRRQRRGGLPLQRAPVVLLPAAHRHGRDRRGAEDRQLHRHHHRLRGRERRDRR